MNRRDTIIIAVLLNAALLAILFVMAINNDDNYGSENSQAIVDVTEQTSNTPQEILTINATTQNSTLQTGDEIDNALKQYADNPQLILVEDEVESLDKETVEPPPAITTNPPQNPEPAPTTQPSKYVDIVVKKGDALEKIARANNTTVDAIKKENNLTSNRLNIGQELRVPVNTKKSSSSSQNKSSANKEEKTVASVDNEPEYYTIKSGDNPWKIAKQFHVKFDDLLKMNNLNEDKARNLKIGDKLRVK